MNKLKEILTSWIISINPSKEQIKQANERLEICNKCENKSSILFDDLTICNICGCPLCKKIFSPENDPCPLSKWK